MLGNQDAGIDLVALTKECDYWAIQCKCYEEDTRIDKPAVDTFLLIEIDFVQSIAYSNFNSYYALAAKKCFI